MGVVEGKVLHFKKDGISKSSWKKVEVILEKAARYDLENDELLYQSIRNLRKYGGTLAIVWFWRYVQVRIDSYNQVIENEIRTRVIRKMKKIIVLLTFLNGLFLLYILKMYVK